MRYCLTTTSDERFWADDDPMIFLDKGCIRYSQERKLYGKNHIIYKSRWVDFEEFKRSNEYLEELQNRLRDTLMSDLNLLHSVDYDYRSWNILIGWWLKRYLGYMFYKYEMIREICEKYDVYLIGRNESIPCYVGTTLDAVKTQSESDWYNAIVGERIAQWLSIPIERKVVAVANDTIIHQDYEKTRTSVLFGATHTILSMLSAGGKSVIYDYLHDLSKKDAINGIMKRLLCYKYRANDNTQYDQMEISIANRKGLLHNFAYNNDFEKMIGRFISEDIPIAYVEAFSVLKKKAKRFFGNNKSFFYSHNAWFNDEIAKSYLAAERKKGLILCGIQHGGTAIHVEDISSWDVQCVDRYYTWGWEKSFKECKVKALPSIKLSKQSCQRLSIAELCSDDILYVGTLFPRYTLEFRYKYSVLSGEYVEDQVNLISCMSHHNMPFRTRLYPIDYGWDMASRIRGTVKDCKIEACDIPFHESYMNSKICIFDVIMTGWGEVYVANKPLIFIVPYHMEYYHPELLDDIERLKQVGIYHNSIETAVDYLAGISDNVDAWWRDTERQKNMNQFASKFTYHSNEWQREWFKELVQNEKNSI